MGMWKPSRRTVLRSMGGAGVVGIAGHAVQGTRVENAPDESWPRPRYDAANTGYAPENTATAADVEVAWTADIESHRDFRPVIADGTWFRPTSTGEVVASSMADGTERWWVEFDADSVSVLAAVDDTVYVQTTDGTNVPESTVHALSATDGAERWERAGGVATIVDDVAYRVGDGVAALSARERRGRWRVSGQFSTVSVADGTVYAVGVRDRESDASGDGDRVYAFSASDGAQQWVFEPDGTDVSTPVVRDETVYFETSASLVYAVSASDGTERWKTVFDAGAAPVVTDDTVFVMSAESLSARAKDDGSERWQSTADFTGSTPVVVGDTVYVGTSEGLSALAAADGTEQWHFETQWPVTQSPAVVDGTVLFVSRDPRPNPGGTVYALRGSDPSTTTTASPTPTTHESTTRSTTQPTTRKPETDSPTPPETVTAPTASSPADDPSVTEGTRTATTGQGGPGFGVVTTLASLGFGGWRLLANRGDSEE